MSRSRGSAFFESLQIFCLVSLDNPWKHWWEVEGGGERETASRVSSGLWPHVPAGSRLGAEVGNLTLRGRP